VEFRLTDYNQAISIVSLFMLIGKLISIVMHVYFPILGVLVGFALTGLYTASIVGQAGPDYADSRYPSPSPWYLRKGCAPARSYGAYQYCQMEQGGFFLAVFMTTLYAVNLGLCIWAMLPNKKIDEEGYGEDDDYTGPGAEKETWEMQTPPTPRTGGLFTPRTQAFNTLNSKYEYA
jgi:hypothetical protein